MKKVLPDLEVIKANRLLDEMVRSARKKDALISLEEIPIDGSGIIIPKDDILVVKAHVVLADFKTAQLPLFK